MKNKYLKLLVVALAVAVIVPQITLAAWWNPFSWGWVNKIFRFQKNEQKQEQVICTQDAKLCPDGSYVGRQGPKCEFKPCPKAKDETAGWKTYTNNDWGVSFSYPIILKNIKISDQNQLISFDGLRFLRKTSLSDIDRQLQEQKKCLAGGNSVLCVMPDYTKEQWQKLKDILEQSKAGDRVGCSTSRCDYCEVVEKENIKMIIEHNCFNPGGPENRNYFYNNNAVFSFLPHSDATDEPDVFIKYGTNKDQILSTFKFINNQPMVGGDKDSHGCIGSAGYTWCEAKKKCLRSWEESCLPSTCIDRAAGEDNALPVITSLSLYSGPIGTPLEIRGCNFLGFESDKIAWIENSQGKKGILYGQEGSNSKILKVILNATLCQKDTSYSGLPCDLYLSLEPGVYKIYTQPWGKRSNEANFTITK